MKQLFFVFLFQFILVSAMQAATYYSSPLGYWCLARNGKSYCFRNFPANNLNDIFVVDRKINLKGDIQLKGNLIIEENGELNISEGGSLVLEGSLEIHFAGVLNVEKNLNFAENSKLHVDRYGAINVDGDFINYSAKGDIMIDGKLEVLGIFENQGIIAGLGKIISPGTCISYPEAITFGEPGCGGINMFTLPASLFIFEAISHKDLIQLTWMTDSEVDFAYFQVERAGHNNLFENIGHLFGKGEGTALISYSFEDKSPHRGQNMYRLKSVDKNGTYDYHHAVVVNHNPEAPKNISLYPNPFEGQQLQIALNFIPEKNTTVSFVNSQGKMFLKREISSMHENMQLENILEPGMYILLIENQDLKIRQRLIVK